MSVKTTPKARYTQSRVRSAIAPHTIASETAANATWNRYAAAAGTAVNHENGACPIGEQLVDRREEARAADEAVAPVAEREPEPDEEVDDRREREDQGVLGRDVADVLHPRQPRLQEGEARLHEDHEDRRDDHPDRAGREGKSLVLIRSPPPRASSLSGCA